MDRYISGWKKAAMLENVPLWNEGVNRHVTNFSKAMPEQRNWENDVNLAVFLKFCLLKVEIGMRVKRPFPWSFL